MGAWGASDPSSILGSPTNMKRPTKKSIDFLRNFVFGVEDSLVSTVGLLSGVAIAGTPRRTIILSGVVLIFVEAFSMGAGSFLSDHSAEEYKKQHATSGSKVVKTSLVMFFSYFFTGFIPLAPYLFTTPSLALPISIGTSLLLLTALGVYSAKQFKGNILRKGVEMLLVGGFAIAIGVGVGSLLHNLKY